MAQEQQIVVCFWPDAALALSALDILPKLIERGVSPDAQVLSWHNGHPNEEGKIPVTVTYRYEEEE